MKKYQFIKKKIVYVILFSFLVSMMKDIMVLGDDSIESTPDSEPIVYELDEDNRDEQGILYTFDETNRCATVGDNSIESNSSGYSDKSGEVILPDIVKSKEGYSYRVTRIASTAFRSCIYLISLDISDSVRCAENGAFSGSYLRRLKIGSGLIDFTWCSSLRSTVALRYLRFYDVSKDNPRFSSVDGVLYNKDKTVLLSVPTNYEASSLVIPDTVEEIGYQAFLENTTVKHVTFPKKCRRIAEAAFYNCHALVGADLKYVDFIDHYAFYGSGIQWVRLKKGVVIRMYVFDGFCALKMLYVPDKTRIVDCNCNVTYVECCVVGDDVSAGDTSDQFLGAIKWRTKMYEIGKNNYGLSPLDTKDSCEESEHNFEEKDIYSVGEATLHGEVCSKCGDVRNAAVKLTTDEEEFEDNTDDEYIIRTLDDNNMDNFGVSYTLSTDSKLSSLYATVKLVDISDELRENGTFVMPDYVEKDGKKYCVIKISGTAFDGNPYIENIQLSRYYMQSTWGDEFKGMEFVQNIDADRNVYYFNYNNIAHSHITDGVKRSILHYPVQHQDKSFNCYSATQGVSLSSNYLENLDVNYVYRANVNLPNLKHLKFSDLFESFKASGECDLEIFVVPDTSIFGFDKKVSVDLTYLKKLKFVYFASCTELSGNYKVFDSQDFLRTPDGVQYAMNEDGMTYKMYVPENVTTIKLSENTGRKIAQISGVAGSYAEEFAEQQNIPFVAIDGNKEYEWEKKCFYENEYIRVEGLFCEELGIAKNLVSTDGVISDVYSDETKPIVLPSASVTPSVNPSPTPTPTVSTVPVNDVEPTGNITGGRSAKAGTSSSETFATGNSAKTQETSLYPAVSDVRLSTKDNKTIQIVFSSVGGVSGYEIFRSEKEESGYRVITSLPSDITKYVDRDIKPNKRYYYRIKTKGGMLTVAQSFSVNGMTAPKIKISKGKKGKIRFCLIKLKKYKGSYVEIYVKKGKGRYKKIKLKNSRIKKYKGKFKLKLNVKKVKLRFKVRTYKKKRKKKIFSMYAAKKIAV